VPNGAQCGRVGDRTVTADRAVDVRVDRPPFVAMRDTGARYFKLTLKERVRLAARIVSSVDECASSERRHQPSDLWIWEIRQRLLTQVTSDPPQDQLPVRSPDGQRMVWTSDRGGGLSNLHIRAADGTGEVKRLTDSPKSQRPSSFTPDGTQLVIAEADPTRGAATVLAILCDAPAGRCLGRCV
jgi:dipeptidyl aminopeptidase/acylaminoacyl peptidase